MSDSDDRSAYQRKYEARLDELRARIDQVQAKMRAASADKEIDYRQRLEELRQKRDALAGRLKEMRDAGQESWSQLRQGVERAANDLEAAWRAAKDKLK